MLVAVSMTKVVVVGTGSMGYNHARVCSELGILAGVIDQDTSSAKRVGELFDVPYYSDFEHGLEDIEPIGAIIATPTFTHNKLAKVALERGVNILVEKPISDNLVSGEEIVNLAIDRGLVCAVGHIERFNPIIKTTKRLIERGDLGEIITISSRRVSNFPGRIRDVGVILDLGIHDIDNSIFLMGSKPISVYCTGGTHNDIEHEDHVTMTVRFENGKSAVMEVNWITPMKVRKLSLTCDMGHVELDYIDQSITMSSSRFVKPEEETQFPAKIEFDKKSLPVEKDEPLKLEIVDFVDSICSDNQPYVSGLDGLIALRVALAAEESLETGMVVNIG